MLLEMGRPEEALREYEASLREAPGRFNSLYGAGRAAEAADRREVAARMYGALLAQCVAGSPRVELARARKFREGSTAALERGAAGPDASRDPIESARCRTF